MTHTSTETLPHWQLDSIFPGLDSPEFDLAKTELRTRLELLETFIDDRDIRARSGARVTPDVAALCDELLSRVNDLYRTFSTLNAYLSGFVATDAFNDQARAEASALRPLASRLSVVSKRTTAWLGSFDPDALIAESEVAREHAYTVRKSALEAMRLLSDEAEAVVSGLEPTAGSAWARLHSDLVSRTTIRTLLPGRDNADYTLSELRNLQSEPDRDLRRAAYDAEISLLAQNDVSFAAAMNSIKGQVDELSGRRGWARPLDEALFANAITAGSLAALQQACRERFPVLRRYLGAKAALLGLDRLAWYDLRAPLDLGGGVRRYSWDEAQALVIGAFGRYSDKLADYAKQTFAAGWIDVPPRKGKRNGAFCMPVLGVKESRIMLNFGGQLDDVFTLAHELGHGYHNACQFEAERTPLQKSTPMTLAETASIFCETIVVNALLERADDRETLAILEQDLLSTTQLVIDIDSRFRFEQTVFERRRERELSIDELNGIMLDAQAETYGDALEADARHRYMWAHKGHYYSTGRSFYNFPYTFGMLFGLGLYKRYQDEPDAFRANYDDLLASTGMDEAAPLAARFGINIEDVDFWRGALSLAETRVGRYEELAGALG
ncbi:MAG: M3 family oligoendopeptidase [Trueperaceae bacterium]|nr:M3 family oligoendopeptidase [Trueperaceae bacterium]